MVKILEKGTVPETTPITHRCTHCKTLFEFLPAEARYVSDQRDGDCYEVGCPVCERKCWTPVPRR